MLEGMLIGVSDGDGDGNGDGRDFIDHVRNRCLIPSLEIFHIFFSGPK